MVLNFTFTPTPSFKYGSNIQSRACCSIRDLTSGVGALSATTVLTVPFLAISSTNLIAYAPSAFLSVEHPTHIRGLHAERSLLEWSHLSPSEEFKATGHTVSAARLILVDYLSPDGPVFAVHPQEAVERDK